jgi:hypothetical protein
MMGLLGELREYLTIWAIGTIIGVTKYVDMKFTRDFDRARFLVLVLDPFLIHIPLMWLLESIFISYIFGWNGMKWFNRQ